MKLCDLHTHILPGVDDGAKTMEYALQMLENAVASDVELLAVTPHCNGAFPLGNFLDSQLLDRFAQLKEAASGLPIELVLGAEVAVTEQLPQLLSQGKLPTINGGRYLLTEFGYQTQEAEFAPMLQNILDLGYIPLIAHPERYNAVCMEPSLVGQWLDMGCHIQLTGGSVLGTYGRTVRRTAGWLLKNSMVACIASDAHNLNQRSNYLQDVCDHLTVQYSKQYARSLMYHNPAKICHNETL